MLRYTSGSMAAKPVDYYRPLTVDVSVEYELPQHVAPPKGSAPLLIIHPSAYFRSKPTSQSPAKQVSPLRPASATTNANSRLGGIASTLYYLSTNGLPSNSNVQNTSSPSHIKGHRFGHQTEHTRITRSRSAAKASIQGSTCDEYGGRMGNLSVQSHSTSQNHRGGRSGGSGIRKSSTHQNPNHNVSAVYSGTYGNATPESTSYISKQRETASNKRLRMMSQTQQPVHLQNHPPLMEPLNLALTPTAPAPPAYNNQFSSFLGYGLQLTNQNPGYQSSQFLSAQTQRSALAGGKEGPVPVDKGSGSDSGVCSENDSDDVSPPMVPFSSASHSRRFNLSSQEIPNSGCYCCCCPSTSSRKSSKATSKVHQPIPATFSGGLSNYGNFFNVIHGQQQLLADGGVPPLGGSPMDSSGSPPHNQHSRKWFQPGNVGILPEVVNAPPSLGKWYQV